MNSQPCSENAVVGRGHAPALYVAQDGHASSYPRSCFDLSANEPAYAAEALFAENLLLLVFGQEIFIRVRARVLAHDDYGKWPAHLLALQQHLADLRDAKRLF